MDRSIAVGLALVVLLAGCNAPASGTPVSSVTPAPVPDAGGVGRLAPGELAPGVEASGVTDADRLARAHAAVLADTSYRVNQTISRTAPNGSVASRYVTHARFAAAPGRFVVALSQTDRTDGTLATRRLVRFADGRRVYEAVTEANRSRYRVVRDAAGDPRRPTALYPSNFTNRRAVARLLALVGTTVTDRWVADGTRYVRLESTGPPSGADVPPLRNVSLAATVAASGLVTDYRVAYDVRRAGAPVHVVVAVSYAGVGATAVRAPPWLDRANATA